MKQTNDPNQRNEEDLVGRDPRATSKSTVKNYINNPSSKTKKDLKAISTSELLLAQHSMETWESFLRTKDLFFKRYVCAKVYHLTDQDIGDNLGISSTAVHGLLTNVLEPKDQLRIFKLAIMLHVPWQVIFKEQPINITLKTFWEYYIDGAAKWVNIEDIYQERQEVQSISGYIIQNPSSLFEEETTQITGRWVRSYLDFDYFEFHLSRNPVLDSSLIQKILILFPSAKAILTTYTPLRPCTRSLWVLHERKTNGHKWIVSELEHRDKTIIHYKST